MTPRPPPPTLFPYTTLFRSLAARGLRDAQRALVGSGVFIILQFALFLLVGTSLWLASADPGPAMRSDAIYPTFAINQDRKSTRLNSSHTVISYAVFCLKKKN